MSNKSKLVTILGSTGSVGKQALDVIAANPGRFKVAVLTSHQNVDLLIEQAKLFKPKMVVMTDDQYYSKLKDELASFHIKIVNGENALIEAASEYCDIFISAVVGIAGLAPTMEALKHGKIVGLACKESLVCAGSLMVQEAKKHNAKLLPIDSEHQAVYQIFDHDNPANVSSITITASGGPFLNYSLEEMAKVTPEQAIAHPIWRMGKKISVDCATMMNKALEVIEAKHLFSLKPEQIQVIIHPQSLIHAFVSYIDGSVLAQVAKADMRVPIQFVLTWPAKVSAHFPIIDIMTLSKMTFMPPDEVRFPLIREVQHVLRESQATSIIFNTVNELAVDYFLNNKIGFLDISSLVIEALGKVERLPINCLADVLEQDVITRNFVKSYMKQKYNIFMQMESENAA